MEGEERSDPWIPFRAPLEVLAMASFNMEIRPTVARLRRGRPDDGRYEDAVGCEIRRERKIYKVTAKPTVAK